MKARYVQAVDAKICEGPNGLKEVKESNGKVYFWIRCSSLLPHEKNVKTIYLVRAFDEVGRAITKLKLKFKDNVIVEGQLKKATVRYNGETHVVDCITPDLVSRGRVQKVDVDDPELKRILASDRFTGFHTLNPDTFI